MDTNGFLQSNAVLNDLYMLDANSFGWTSGSNGAAIMGHSTCYIKSCNCLVVFGGTSTGNGADANAVSHFISCDNNARPDKFK